MLDKELKIKQKTIHNRVVFQPMEGCDCNYDGSPSKLTENKYLSFAKSGAGTIWFEANAVCEEGRTNFRQMMLTDNNVDKFKDLIKSIKETSNEEFGYTPIIILQLTHSGRQSIKPMIAYRNEVYEEIRQMTDDCVVSDDYLDTLPEKYAHSALLAKEAGFDGVDIKSCHGYLFQELLSAFNRDGKYGGAFENRIRLFLNCIKAVKETINDDSFILASRFGVCDMVKKPYGFGTDENCNVDLYEPKKLIKELENVGIDILNITIGNPYYNPYVNRPYRIGINGEKSPETPQEGLKRFYEIEKELKSQFPNIIIVGSGLSYYRENLIEKAEEQLQNNVCDLVGFGRVTLAYPQFYNDYIKGQFDFKKCCVACSKCTKLMRLKQVAGCAVFNEYYKKLLEECVK